jgi:hypothetical protein
MNTQGRRTLADRLLVGRSHTRLDNTHLAPADAAERLAMALSLPRC